MFYFLFIAELEKLVKDFHSRIERLEGDKWDLEHQIKMKDYQVRGSHSLARYCTARRRQAGCRPACSDADCLPAGCRVPLVSCGRAIIPPPVSCSNSLPLQAVSHGGPRRALTPRRLSHNRVMAKLSIFSMYVCFTCCSAICFSREPERDSLVSHLNEAFCCR